MPKENGGHISRARYRSNRQSFTLSNPTAVPVRSFGYESLSTCERVRRSAKCKDIPVLVISSSDSPKERAETTQLGISGYFRKQPSYQEFLKVGEVLREIISAISRGTEEHATCAESGLEG